MLGISLLILVFGPYLSDTWSALVSFRVKAIKVLFELVRILAFDLAKPSTFPVFSSKVDTLIFKMPFFVLDMFVDYGVFFCD